MAQRTLRHRVVIEQYAESTGDYGEAVRTWSTWRERWADIRPLNGREILLAQQVGALTSHEITLRHMDGLTAAMRINYNGRYFNIGSLRNEGERDRWLILQCTEVT